MNMTHNLSRLFYLSGDNKPVNIVDDINFERDISKFNENLPNIKSYENYYKSPIANCEFELTTVYPGLLLGAGYTHPALKKVDSSKRDEIGDFQLGFFFDHTTGLPVIPGSSVKGVLKSVFPKKNDKYQKEKLEYINAIIKEQLNKQNTFITYDNWELIFFGDVAAKRKHIFFDAYICGLPENKRLFEEDYITPHTAGIFKDPTPIRFLKIGPGIKIKFQFKLFDYDDDKGNLLLTKEKIADIFKQILLDFGIGAKRNIGYGQFI